MTRTTYPWCRIEDRELITVKWRSGNKLKVARFRPATDDGVVTLDSVFIRDGHDYDYVREPTLGLVNGQVQKIMQAEGYEPAEEAAE